MSQVHILNQLHMRSILLMFTKTWRMVSELNIQGQPAACIRDNLAIIMKFKLCPEISHWFSIASMKWQPLEK